MKKIITSAAVAVALSTVAFAAATINTDAYDKGATYNKAYVETTAVELNTTTGKAVTFNGFPLVAGNWLVFELEGANFETNASVIKYKLLDASDVTKVLSAPASTIQEANKVQFKLNSDINDTVTVALGIEVAASGTDLNETALILPKGTQVDATIKASALNDTGATLLNSETKDATLVSAADTAAVTADIVCGNDLTVRIDSTNKKLLDFSTGSGASSTTTADCNLTVTGPSVQTFDFNYADANITTIFSAGDFDDGNFSSIISASNPTVTSGTQTFVGVAQDLNGTDYKENFTWKTNGISDLVGSTYQVEVKVDYNGTKASETVSAAADAMKVSLSTYQAKILNVRVSDDKTIQTSLKIYNETSTEAPVDIKAVDKNGVEYTATGVVTAPANGSIFLSATAINTAVGSIIPNGYSLTVSMGVDAKKGDIVAFQKDADGKTPLRVDDNSEKNRGQ